jgi:hypothetical protein
MLMPAHMGLSVLDAFAASLPVITTRHNNHSPEFAYVKDGRNALLSRNFLLRESASH